MKPGLFNCPRWILLCFFTCLVTAQTSAQDILNKVLPSISVNNQRLDNVLEIISNKGDFYFSYNSNIIRKDSLVSIVANNKTVRQVLDMIFHGNLEYKQSGNYIILRLLPLIMTLVTSQAVSDDKLYAVSGYVLDETTGQKIRDASIYEKQRLVSTLTNAQGYFKLRLKSKSGTAALTVSKEYYQDTTVHIQPKFDQQVTITIMPVEFTGKMITVSPNDYLLPDSIAIDVKIDSSVTRYIYLKADSFKVEKTAFGDFLISSRQKIQSLNLKRFFINKPFQLSLTPGLGTQGSMSPQVVNKFSFNIFGGYTGGVSGMELGGLFNIDKKNVQYLQIGGLFNIVGGSVKGVQIGGLNNTVLKNFAGIQVGGLNNTVKSTFNGVQVAGINNTVLNNFRGVQVAGIHSLTKGSFRGVQISGIYNHVTSTVKGIQISGVSNFAPRNVYGGQVSGIGNISVRTMNGLQIAGVFNYAKKLRGVQIGLINVADSSSGFSIGLINIVLKGYHKLSISSNELIHVNASFKTGNAILYNILLAGANADTSRKIYSVGYGIGTELFHKKRVTLNPELTSQYLYLGSWNYLNLLSKFSLNVNLKLSRFISIYAGPVFNAYYSDQPSTYPGFKSNLPSATYKTFDLGISQTSGWIGWNAGINFF